MKINYKKVWARVGISGLIITALFGNLIYMNLRASDPILPGWEEYDQTRFEELMNRSEPVMVEIYASWCPTCLLQHKALETLHSEGRGPNIRAVRVDFDRDVAFRQKHGFNHTGTIVIFQNGQPRMQETGLVTAAKISAFLESFEKSK